MLEKELKVKLDLACERFKVAMRKNSVITTEQRMLKKWVQMSLTCTNR